VTKTAPRGLLEPSTVVFRGLRVDVLTVGCAALLVATKAVVGVRLLEREVPLHVNAPPLGAQWLPHVSPETVPAVLVAVLVVLCGPSWLPGCPGDPCSGSPRSPRWPGR
jgi:hypothetical protein